MSLWKKAIVGAVGYLVLLLVLFVFVNGFPLHRREFDRAYIAFLDNPNPHTESLLHAQSRKTMMIQLEDAAAAALVIWITGFSAYRITSRIRKKDGAHRQTGTPITSK